MDSIQTIIKQIREKKFYIYGAGGHGKKLLKCIKKMGLLENFKGFVVTDNSTLESNGVGCVDDIDRNATILIAAHITNSKNMESYLYEHGFKNYYVTYHVLQELYWGMPNEHNIKVNCHKVISGCKKIYYLCAIYSAIDFFMGKNQCGESIYLKTMRLTSDEETAYNRWRNFQRRIAQYVEENNPIDERYPILTDLKGEYVLDGAHRLMLAFYFEQGEIYANRYSISHEEYEEFYNDSIYEKENFFPHFNGLEITCLDSILSKLRG